MDAVDGSKTTPDTDVKVQRKDELTNRQRLLQYEEKTDKATVELSSEPEQPELITYLITILYDIGPVLSGAMDLRSLQYPDIQAWENVCGIKLDGWEARTILRFSNVYLSQFQKARDGGPVPHLGPITEEKRQLVSDKIRMIFDARVKSTRVKGRRVKRAKGKR